MKKLLASFLCLLFAATVSAETIIVDGVEMNSAGPFNGLAPTNITLSGSLTLATLRSAGMDTSQIASATIADGSTEITTNAFYDCASMTNVLIPNTVTNICESAFCGCAGLPEIVVPKSVQQIGYAAFNGCSSLTNMVLPFVGANRSSRQKTKERFTEIWSDQTAVLGYVFGSKQYDNGYMAKQSFRFCKKLGENRDYGDLYITSSQYTYWFYIQQYCEIKSYCLPLSLCTVTITDDKVINVGAFSGCSSLNSIFLNEGIVTISERAFYDCWQLKTIVLPSTVTSIVGCMTDCYVYEVSYGPEWLPHESLDLRAFGGMCSIREITLPSGRIKLSELLSSYASVTNVILTSNSTTICESEFEGCASLTSVTIPASVTEIGNKAFANCSSLTNVTYFGNAPFVGGTDLYTGTSESLTSWVTEESTGWDGGLTSTALPSNGMWPVSILGSRSIRHVGSVDPQPTPNPDPVNPQPQPDDPQPDNPQPDDPTPVVTTWQVCAAVALEGAAKGTARVSAAQVTKGGSVTLVARTGNSRSIFAYWQDTWGTVLGYTARLTVTPAADTCYTAVFRDRTLVTAPALAAEDLAAIPVEAMVGVQYRATVPLAAASRPARFSASRLPSGLRLDATTGEITGVPTRAGTYAATITVASTAKASLRTKVPLTITVRTLPTWAQGTFNGYVSGVDAAGETVAGTARAAVSSTGRISGTFRELGTNYTFLVSGYDATSEFAADCTNLVVCATAKSGKATRTVTLTADATALRGTLDDEATVLYRAAWKDAEAKAFLAAYTGLYTAQLVSVGGFGHGYLSFTIAADGSVKVAGALADGTAVSGTATLVREADQLKLLTILLPSACKGGCLFASFTVNADRTLTGDGFWQNRATGISDAFEGVGAWYDTKESLATWYAGPLYLDVVAPDLLANVKVTDEDENGKKLTETLSEWQAAVSLACEGSLAVTLDAKGAAFVVPKSTKPVLDKASGDYLYDGANDAALTLKFTRATGLFTGSFTSWYDYVSDYNAVTGEEKWTHTSRTVTFKGIAVRGEGVLRGFYVVDGISYPLVFAPQE